MKNCLFNIKDFMIKKKKYLYFFCLFIFTNQSIFPFFDLFNKLKENKSKDTLHSPYTHFGNKYTPNQVKKAQQNQKKRREERQKYFIFWSKATLSAFAFISLFSLRKK